MRKVAALPFAQKQVAALNCADFLEFAERRLAGDYPNLRPILPQTLMVDFIVLRAVNIAGYRLA